MKKVMLGGKQVTFRTKISNSKKELARIISENGGWRDGAEWAAQCKSDVTVSFYSGCAPYRDGDCWWGDHLDGTEIKILNLMPNWHQTILSRDEYFHLYPAPDDGGWISFNGDNKPEFGDMVVDVKLRHGGISGCGPQCVDCWDWTVEGSDSDIIAYRLHKPEQAKSTTVGDDETSLEAEFDEPTPEAKPTIEQLAADYRNLKDYADRKQQEADDAKADADEALRNLELAGEEIGLIVTPIAAKQEPELVITDWRDLKVGDVIWWCGDGENAPGEYEVKQLESDDYDGFLTIAAGDYWVHYENDDWKLIRRP